MTPQDAWNFIVECRRVLKPGGVLRLCFPDIKRILTAESDAFDRLCQQNGWGDGTREGSVRATLFCHGHLGAWTVESLATLLEAAEFEVSECRPGQSIHPELQGVDQHWKTVGSEIHEIENRCGGGSEAARRAGVMKTGASAPQGFVLILLLVLNGTQIFEEEDDLPRIALLLVIPNSAFHSSKTLTCEPPYRNYSTAI